MKTISYLSMVMLLGSLLSVGAYADDQVVQFQTSADHMLTPQQVQILKDNLVVKGYAISFQPMKDEHGNPLGDKYIMAKNLPADQHAASKLEELALLGAAMMEYPQDQDLAKSVEAKAQDYISKGMPKEPGDPENSADIAQGYRIIAILMQVADVPKVNFNSDVNPFLPWAEVMVFVSANNLHHQLFPGHKWKLDKDGMPMLVMPNGKQSWAKLKAAGLDPNNDHRMPADWSYTKDGFVKGKDGKAEVDPL